MVERLVEMFSQIGDWAYLLLFVAATLESAAFLGLLVPGETLTLVAGVLVSAGVLGFPAACAAAAAGAALGDSIGYELGRRLGRPWVESHGPRIGVRLRALKRLDALFTRHGGKAVVLARFISFLRALAPFIAGSSRMPYHSFLFYNVMGGVLWAVAFISLGYALGHSWWIAERWIGRASLVAGGLLLAVAILWIRGHGRRRRTATAMRHDRADDVGSTATTSRPRAPGGEQDAS
jgi:membrane protein DedA with SNARE-associated domain